MEYVVGMLISIVGLFAWNYFQIKKDQGELSSIIAKGVVDDIEASAKQSVADKSLEDLVDDANHRYPAPPVSGSGDDHS